MSRSERLRRGAEAGGLTGLTGLGPIPSPPPRPRAPTEAEIEEVADRAGGAPPAPPPAEPKPAARSKAAPPALPAYQRQTGRFADLRARINPRLKMRFDLRCTRDRRSAAVVVEALIARWMAEGCPWPVTAVSEGPAAAGEEADGDLDDESGA
jgi:hypothetical protein